MATENEKDKMLAAAGNDDVDFSSGYETQYKQEYRPIKKLQVPPPDKANAWYRDVKTICLIGFLIGIFLMGSVCLVALVFTSNPWNIAAITSIYICVAIIVIYLEVKSIHVR